MPKVVLQMVAFGLEHVVIVVCDLPAPTARLRDVCDVVRMQAMMGDKAVVIELFARFGTHDCELEPMGRQGIVTSTQAHVVDIRYRITSVKRPFQRRRSSAAIPSLACRNANRSESVVWESDLHVKMKWKMFQIC